jgi:hypothetical protein
MASLSGRQMSSAFAAPAASRDCDDLDSIGLLNETQQRAVTRDLSPITA